MSRYLFIGFHIDDCELSCGGTMIKLINQGNQVDYFPLSFGSADGVEFLSSQKIIGFWKVEHPIMCSDDYTVDSISDFLYSIRNNYDYVFTHSVNDRHSHHKMAGEASLRVFNCNIITYMGSWNGNENPNYFVELTGDQLEKKINALYCYRSQSHRPYMSSEFIHSYAVYNGVKCGKKYAEGFKIERLIQ